MVYLDTLSYLPPPRASLFVAVTTLFYQLILVGLLSPHSHSHSHSHSLTHSLTHLAYYDQAPPAPWTTMTKPEKYRRKKTASGRFVGGN